MLTTRQRRPLLSVVAAIAAVALTAGCSCSAPAAAWKTDDLLKDGDRYYTTCEDPANERHEREVWLTDDQAAEHTEGQDCPAGPVRTADYWQEADADKKRSAVVVTKPTKSPAPAPAGAGGGKTPVTTKSTKAPVPASPKATAANPPAPTKSR